MRKIKRSIVISNLLLTVVIAFALLGFQDSIGAEVGDRSENVQRLRYEWQRQAIRTLRQIDSNCCAVDPCSYCFFNKEDGLCNCASDLNHGKETCPECLGKWLEGHGGMHAWMGFQRVYPIFSGWIIAQGGIPAQCPMMGGRGGSMGMMGMGGRFGGRNLATSNSIKEMRINLKMKAREIKLLSDYNCCMAGGGSCTYCLQDPHSSAKTICDCKDRLKAGREVCPECLGTWASGEWNQELGDEFLRVYPSLGNLIAKGV